MKEVLFISDLHLDASRPQISELFIEFLRTTASRADALFILGDLFEAWIGDDDPDSHHGRIQDALRELTSSGVPTWFMHGNRDFLIGDDFAARTGVQLLVDPTVIELHGRRTLLMHGDTLCMDDTAYQQFRAMVRAAEWQRQFLGQPLAARQEFAAKARAESKAAQAGLAMDIMDVNRETTEKAFTDHDVCRMIHGHTHRPGVHTFELHGKTRQRIVLGDWYEQGSVLKATPAGLSLLRIGMNAEGSV